MKKVFWALVALIFLPAFVSGDMIQLMDALKKDEKPRIEELINSKNIDLNSGFENLLVVYLYAKEKNAELEFVRYLLDKGVNPDYAPGIPAIDIAIMQGRSDIVSLLIEKGADVNIIEKRKVFSPLGMALLVRDCKVADMLKKAGAVLDKDSRKDVLFIRERECFGE